MKQVIRKGLREIIVDEVADPLCSANHVLIRPGYSLISAGTETADIHADNLVKEVADNPSHLRTIWNVIKKTDPVATFNEVRAKFSDYAVIGYSGAGVIVEKDERLADLTVGQRVAYGGEGTGHGETISVGRNLVARVPDNVTLREASFTTLGAIAMNAVRLAEINVGDVVAVIGLGLIGQLTAQLVRCQGGVVVAIDLDERRVELARGTGADHALIAGDALIDEVNAITNGLGADRVIVAAAAKSPRPLQDGVKMARDRGRVVMVGACPVEIPRAEMYVKELSFMVSRAYGPGSYDAGYEKEGIDYPIAYVRWTENRNMEEFLRLISVGKVDVKPLITHEFDLDDAPAAYKTIMETSAHLAVLLRYASSDADDIVAAYEPKRKIMLAAAPVDRDAVNFALVGAGNLAKWAHLPALKKTSGARLHAVHSASGARGKSYGLRFGASYVASDISEILNDTEIDAVIIATRHKEHAKQAIDALSAGKHVFIEKPMAVTVDECRAINEAVTRSGKRLMVGFNRRFAPDYVEMKKRLASHRQSGAPVVISVRMNSPGLEKGWAAEAEQGGVVVGEGCHFVDLMYWLLDSEPVRVSAEAIDKDNITASFKFADGSIGNFIYTVVGSESSGGEMVEVHAPGIAMRSEDFKGLMVKGRSRRSTSRFFAAKGYDAQLASFVESLRTGNETETTVRDGARATLGCLLMLESAESGEPREICLDEVIK